MIDLDRAQETYIGIKQLYRGNLQGGGEQAKDILKGSSSIEDAWKKAEELITPQYEGIKEFLDTDDGKGLKFLNKDFEEMSPIYDTLLEYSRSSEDDVIMTRNHFLLTVGRIFHATDIMDDTIRKVYAKDIVDILEIRGNQDQRIMKGYLELFRHHLKDYSNEIPEEKICSSGADNRYKVLDSWWSPFTSAIYRLTHRRLLPIELIDPYKDAALTRYGHLMENGLTAKEDIEAMDSVLEQMIAYIEKQIRPE